MALFTVQQGNLTNNRKAPSVMLCARGLDGESYMLTFDQTIGTAYVPTYDMHNATNPLSVILTDGAGAPYIASFSFLRNSVATQAVLDTVTAANNRGVPVLALSADGASPQAHGAGVVGATVQRVVIASDQAATIATEATAALIYARQNVQVSSLASMNAEQILQSGYQVSIRDSGISTDGKLTTANASLVTANASLATANTNLGNILTNATSSDTKLGTINTEQQTQTTALSSILTKATNLDNKTASVAGKGRVVVTNLVYSYVNKGVSYAGALSTWSGVTTPADIHRLQIFDDSGVLLRLSWGGISPTATQQIRIPPGGGDFDVFIPAGSSLYFCTETGLATGTLVINMLGGNA